MSDENESSDIFEDSEVTASSVRRLRQKLKSHEISQIATQTPELYYFNKLREFLKCEGASKLPLNGYIIPNTDPHMSYHLTAYYRRFRLVSGWTGFSGIGVITDNDAAFWINDGNYSKAKLEVFPNWTVFNKDHPNNPNISNWIIENVEPGSRIGCDSKLLQFKKWLELDKKLSLFDIKLAPCNNIIDLIWKHRPLRLSNPIIPLKRFVGKSLFKKIRKIRKQMINLEIDALGINMLDEIAWLLNIRGSDVRYDGVFLAFLIIMQDQVHLFIDKNKYNNDVQQYIKKNNVKLFVHKYEKYYDFLGFLSNADVIKKIYLTQSSSFEEYSRINPLKRFVDVNFISMEKCIKNSSEAKGMNLACRKNDVAFCQLLFWLESLESRDNVNEKTITEQLESYQKEDADYIGPCAMIIAASGTNSASMHYAISEFSKREIKNEILVIDGGAHYVCGTSSTARTLHFGVPTQQQMIAYTSVCQGLLKLMMIKFPENTSGNSLDTLCRLALWRNGLDYAHDSGVGVGFFLKVHEKPVSMGKKRKTEDALLKPNMFIKCGPAYYSKNEFGVRLKNMFQIVSEYQTDVVIHPTSTNVKMLKLHPITFCPFNKKLLLLNRLTASELDCLNKYHKNCRSVLGPILKAKGFNDIHAWLIKKTKPFHHKK